MIDYGVLPDELQGGMQRYVEQGVPTGGFLRAVLENNLATAWRRADLGNRARMSDIVEFLHSLPPACWGSPKLVEDWIGSRMPGKDE